MQPPNPPPPPNEINGDSFFIRNVWNSNLDQEFEIIREIVDDYPYIVMDTEFPGVIRRTGDPNKDRSYRTLRYNVNHLKLIQLGVTFANEHGQLPYIPVPDSGGGGNSNNKKFCVWQFNFREFNVKEDPQATDSIALLRSSGIDFAKIRQDGVKACRFGELATSSGMILTDCVEWVTFHGCSDFAYLLKILTGKDLPETEAEFFQVFNIFFPNAYDIKYMIKSFNLHGGLKTLANIFGLVRFGESHQAGSDSLLTCHLFFKLRETFLAGSLDKYNGVLYGLGIDSFDGGGSSSQGGGPSR